MVGMQAPVQVGEVIAEKYQIERILAAGGMGVVLVARHLQLDRQVAIKFMLPELRNAGVEPDAVERFLREGRAAVKLRGENVAKVLDVDKLPDENGSPYMVMEYLHGGDLAKHIKEHGPLPLAELVDYVLQACVAMAEAHQIGIIHRDLKPSNLFLTRRPDGSPLIKVLDFGISKLFSDIGDAQRTHTAMMMGSPAYMPPEQAESARNVDVRSDIWSLGVILYEAASKKLPFTATHSTAAILAQLIYEQARPLSEAAPSLPPDFCRVVDRCLQKDPDQRFQSVGELATALAPFASEVGRAAIASVHAIIGGGGGGAVRERRASSAAALELAEHATLPATAAPSQAAPAPAATPAVAASAPAPAVAAPQAEAPARDAVVAVSPASDKVGAQAAGGARDDIAPIQSASVAGAAALALDPGGDTAPAKARRDVALGAQQTAPMTTRSGWLEPRRLVSLAALIGLAGLSYLVLRPGGGVDALDQACVAIYKLGDQLIALTGDLSRTLTVLGGPLFQVLAPLALAMLLSRFRLSTLAALALWLLGLNVIHIARSMARAPYEGFSPITGASHPWNYALVRLGQLESAELLSQLTFALGSMLMIGVILHLARRALQQASFRP